MQHFIHSIDIPWPKGVTAFQTCGYPEPTTPYGHFNLANHVHDDPNSVTHNRDQLTYHLNLERPPLWLNQQHTDTVVTIDQPYSTPPIADAAITEHAKQTLIVMTADCVPILLASHNNPQIAVIHAGWRGLASSIISKTVQQMHGPAASLVAWIGPCISKKHYQVDNRTAMKLLPKDQCSDTLKQSTDKVYIDLKDIARAQLLKAGVETLYIDSACTYTDMRYYSYRRQNICGRQVSGIMIST